MKIIKNVLATAVVASMVSCGNQTKQVRSLETELDSVSYAVGLNMAQSIRQGFNEVNEDVFVQGFENGMDSVSLLIKTAEVQSVIRSYFEKKQQAEIKKQQEETIKKAEVNFGENKKVGEDFLSENKNKEGVITTESGLQYIVLKEGKGETPKISNRVKVHYHGTTIDGAVFDSSVEKGSPATFGLTQVIKGWTEGLQLMKEGAKYKFYIPQDLAYGYQQKGDKIKPFSTLIFEVELLEVLK